ncbi:MAG: glycosyltransferase family 4 protein [Clostridia bacterium]|nr:glycosyltransferase family 4 protein [Clostridia bacterium]
MKLLVSSCARLFKTPDGKIYTPVAYGYDFYKRYLKVFDEVIVAGFCDSIDDDEAKSMLLVSGEGISFFELPYPHGEWEYIFKRRKIQKALRGITDVCDAMLLRVPETLCFLIMDVAIRKRFPFAIEVTSDPLKLYTKASCPSKYRLVYKIWYYIQLRRASFFAQGTSYVTQYGLQRHYPPNLRKKGNFTTFYTDTNIKIDGSIKPRELPENRPVRLIHIAVSVGGFAKGHKEAIEALNLLLKQRIDVELTLVGQGDLADKNAEYIKNNGLEPYIRRTGKITADKVIEELDRADIFFFPSYNEGLPRVVVEAMSRALPVIATDIPAHRELLKADYLVPIMDSKSLAEKTAWIIKDADAYKKASAENIEKSKEYDIGIIEKKRTDFYQKIKESAIKK